MTVTAAATLPRCRAARGRHVDPVREGARSALRVRSAGGAGAGSCTVRPPRHPANWLSLSAADCGRGCTARRRSTAWHPRPAPPHRAATSRAQAPGEGHCAARGEPRGGRTPCATPATLAAPRRPLRDEPPQRSFIIAASWSHVRGALAPPLPAPAPTATRGCGCHGAPAYPSPLLLRTAPRPSRHPAANLLLSARRPGLFAARIPPRAGTERRRDRR